jgi:hypothetical protein
MYTRSQAEAQGRRLGTWQTLPVGALVGVALAGSGCTEKVSLGAWLSGAETAEPIPVAIVAPQLPVLPSDAPDAARPSVQPPVTTPVPIDAGMTVPATPSQSPIDASIGMPDSGGAGVDAGFPTCGQAGTVGPVNRGSTTVGATIPYTDWQWPQPVDSVEFELRIEREPETDLNFWAYQFGFVTGIVGLFGLQANGGFQLEPPTGAVVWGDMLLLWIAGPPLDAELGDSPYPARIAAEYSKGVAWTSIHLQYDWEPCRAYRFRLALESTEPDGNSWYGAWFTDTTTDETVYIGRMLVPMGWGQIATSSSMWTDVFAANGAPHSSCNAIESTSALFGIPVGNDGEVEPLSYNNRFEAPQECGSTRFTEFPAGIRQEVGVESTP